ncbi:hypothetical protein Afil01_09270 [Actinorhabdospora filicis]|uniref:Uncharacterized protein n=1 Tax=Actinorhabdospora filicis TaxID=1785913 RepID=A0A9W6SFB9_9ACTN|nr:hypothetical protein [Actinorhabdospora filicis]GLZ76120.1 hypothetical protein Afil01_09270 [Actinorhabdospora filicis]
MKKIGRIGDALLRRFVPKGEAHAACPACRSTANCTLISQDTWCDGGRLRKKCCYRGSGCQEGGYCTSWMLCGTGC